MYIFICTNIFVYTYTCKTTFFNSIYLCIHINTYILIYIYNYIDINISTCVSIFISINIFIFRSNYHYAFICFNIFI